MSANKEHPHVFVLPEDYRNVQLANGFHEQVDWNKYRQLQILRPAGGWIEVLDQFELEHIPELIRYPLRFLVLLIDLDNHPNRLDQARQRVPQVLLNRVFILGVLTEPEDLKQALARSYENIGAKLAEDCREGVDNTWEHPLLQHNGDELVRLRQHVRAILF